MNIQKSGLFNYSMNYPAEMCDRLSTVLSMKMYEEDISYLENPLFIGLNRSSSFTALKKKVVGRLEDWIAKSISKAGMVTIIKSVVQGIPTYAMTTFKLPSLILSQKATRALTKALEALLILVGYKLVETF